MDKGKEAANEEEQPLGLDEEDLTAIGLNPCTVSRTYDASWSDNLLGRVVTSEDEAYRLYNEYAFEKGFSIRKGTTRYYEGTRLIRQKEFLCSKEGFKEDPTPCKTTSYNRLDVRTGCKAIIRFTVKEDEWKVSHFVAEHNHELASIEERHLLRSARNVHRPRPKAKGPATASAEIALAVNTGFVERNLSEGQQKLVWIEGGDAQSLFQWFKKKKNNDIMFFHDVQLDQEGRVTNLFWSDGKSRIDYGYFGDVIVFDTTYRINKYNLICAPIFGINHHRGKVMFGCAFLLDESATSFIWLFKSFLECMGNKAPKTVITYQDDQVLIRAVEQVFPNTRHLLCPWHIAKRASSHLVGLYSNTGFCQLFRKCTHHCDNELEFEQSWQRMVEQYDCRNNCWLKTIYRTRQQWSTAFSKNTFSCGLISSQKSESADVFCGISATKVTSLTKFVLEVDDLVVKWRDSELKSNFRCKHGLPNLIIKKSSLCQQAAQIYTHKIFELFEQEYVEGVGALSLNEVGSTGNSSTYHVGGENETDNEKVQIVHFDSSTLTVQCSCKKFESMGILCSHCLSVLHMKKVKAIPQQYILKRWTKNARERVHSHDVNYPIKETEVEYHAEMMRWVYDMITRSQKSPDTRTLLRNGFLRTDQELKKLEAELDSMSIEGNSSADGQKRKKSGTNDSSKSKKRNEVPVMGPTQVASHATVPFASVPPNIQGTIGLTMAPFPIFSPQYLQQMQFPPQPPQEPFQRQ